MERYFKRKSIDDSSQSTEQQAPNLNKSSIIIDVSSLPADPGIRPSIWSYDVNIRDEVRRSYLQKGPCQPTGHDFPITVIGKKPRRFNPNWFIEYPSWLEYSVVKDAAFCLYCYLFKLQCQTASSQSMSDSFVNEGFRNWKKKERIEVHVGKINSSHNEARHKCEDLMNQPQSILAMFTSKTDKDKMEYRVLLTAATDCVRFLLRQGLPFRGHDESKQSLNQGNYLGLFHFLADHNDEVKNLSFANASERLQLTSPKVQKELCRAAAAEAVNTIIKDVGNSYFSILVDEARDIATKEQMAVSLRYVNKYGQVIERFIGIQHVSSTTAVSLKAALDELFARHQLSISRLRGQGYDGASNMQGEYNGLKALILRDNPYAFYVHCFAHQLQLVLVAVAKNHFQIKSLFEFVSRILNTVGASCKRNDALKAIQHNKVLEALQNGDLISGRGLNQETNLKRPGDTRWSSHYTSLISLVTMYSSVIEVLEIVMDDGVNDPQSVDASVLLDVMQSFDFIFTLHVMINILGVTNELSQLLQREDQDIQNAMRLVYVCKLRLQMMRDNGWDSLLNEISSFCNKFEIVIPAMDDKFKARGRPKRKAEEMTNLHHYRVELFYSIIDMQLQELNNRFSEINTELLLCVECLSPINSFSAFKKEKLIRLAQIYENDFSTIELVAIGNQLDNYILDMLSSDVFSDVKDITGLAEKMVAKRCHLVYPLVFRLITLALTLPISTAKVERAFSAMKIVKTRLRNRLADEWLNDCLITYIEKEVFDQISNEDIMQYYQNMQSRRRLL